VVSFSGGEFHWLAVTDDGRVWAWGNNEDAVLGGHNLKNRERPTLVRGLPESVEVVQVAAGSRHSVALGADGSMCAWGANEEGGLGIGRQHYGEWRARPTRVRWPN
jgi:alpha-tubulin suppressor-like RCC1 family protein